MIMICSHQVHNFFVVAAMCVPLGLIASRRCCKGVDHSSDESPKLIPIDEQPNHEIVHALCLGEAQRAEDESLDPGPQINMLALDFLRVLLE